MKYKLIVKEPAKEEIVEIADHYNKLREDLGYEFADAIDIALRDIASNP